MAHDVITLGDVAARGAEMIEIAAGGAIAAVSVARLLAEYGPGAAIGHVLRPGRRLPEQGQRAPSA